MRWGLRASLLVSAPLVMATVAVPLGRQQDIERENLTGVSEVNVVVEEMSDEVEADGLTQRSLLRAVER